MIDFEPWVFTLPPVYLSVGLGVHVAPLVGPEPVTPAYTRLELSGGARWRLGVVTEFAVHEAGDRWGETPSTVVSGDSYVVDVGVTGRREVRAGPVRVYPNLALGLMVGTAPYRAGTGMTQELGDSACRCSATVLGPWAQGGADLGVPVGDVTLLIGAEVGYGLFALGPVGAAHVGIEARL